MAIKNFDFSLTNLKGESVKEQDGKEVVVRDLIVNALGMVFEDERTLTGQKKFERTKLALKIDKGGDIELEPEEIILIKELFGKAYSTFAVGIVYQYLNA